MIKQEEIEGKIQNKLMIPFYLDPEFAMSSKAGQSVAKTAKMAYKQSQDDMLKAGRVNMETKGHCKHGEFDLRKGCPQCIAESKAKAEKLKTVEIKSGESFETDHKLTSEMIREIKEGTKE